MKFAHGKKNRLSAITLGSSRYLIIRPTPKDKDHKYQFIYRSHPSDQKCGPERRGGERSARVTVHDVENNDIVVLLSDGAADNLDDAAYEKCLLEHLGADGVLADPKAFSRVLADRANGVNKVREHARDMKEQGLTVPKTGADKERDDISVVCA